MIAVALDFLLYALSGVFAGVTAATSNLEPHREWGTIAVWGYSGAAIAVWFLRRQRLALTVLTWILVSWVPLATLAWRRSYQEEVYVVEESARRFLTHGTPYLDRASIAALPEPLLGYTPYQPGMAVFGLPRAIFGDHPLTDARFFFALTTAVLLYFAVRLLWPAGIPWSLRGTIAGTASVSPAATGSASAADLSPGLSRQRDSLIRAVQMATVLPLCALTLATGGDDIPVLALCLLAFALAARERFTLAGVAIGAAAAMKLFAWPVAIVLAIYVLHRARPQLGRFLLATLGIPLAVLLPAILVDAQAFLENVVRFPTGHGLVISPAASPLLGHLLAENLSHGRTIALALLLLTGLGIGIHLIRRPPADVRAVAFICAIGLVAAIVLMPSTRFGYLLYPVAFAFWAPCLGIRQPHREPTPKAADPAAS